MTAGGSLFAGLTVDYLINNKKGSSSTTVLGAYHAMFAAYGIAAVVMASLSAG